MNDPAESFRAHMFRCDLHHDGPLHSDGRLHRFKADGDKNRNSWYVLFDGSLMAGAFGCWKRQFKETWHDTSRRYTDREWQQIRSRWAQAEAVQKKADAERKEQARKTAQYILENSHRAAADHPYLAVKRVMPHGELRQSRGGDLVLPLRDADGVLHSLQFISGDGAKKFLPGGRIAGCFFTVADAAGPLVICEGFATGASIHEATGHAVVCTMNCGNLMAVAQSLRGKHQEREIIIAADDDRWTNENPGLTKATEAAKAIAAKLAVPQFTELTNRPTDFNDMQDSKAIRGAILAAAQVTETDDEVFTRLAALAPPDYDRKRESEAKRMNIRVATLDAEVVKRRPKGNTAGDSTEPWAEPVDGAHLLDGLAGEFRRFLVLPEHADTILALWTLHTYSWEQCEYSPMLAITSPVRSCGKSRVLDVLERLTANPFRTGNMSEAVLFRVLSSRKPSVLIDEFDTIQEDRRDALANILKHGFHRAGKVHRVEGDATKEVVEFAVFGPKALACIKLSTLDGATVSRCINIRMQRKKPGSKVDRLRHYNGSEWQRKCLRWTADNCEQIDSTADMPEALGDREQDIYEPLFVLARLAGGDWPKRIKAAALALCGESADASQDGSVTLLGWIQTYFAESLAERVSSVDLVGWLNGRQDAPFAAWGHGRGIGQNDVRRLLAGFDIRPSTVRLGEKTAKGYSRNWFDDAFASYLAGTQTESGNTVTNPVNIGDSTLLAPVTDGECYHTENTENTNKDGHCYSVTAENPENGDDDEVCFERLTQ